MTIPFVPEDDGRWFRSLAEARTAIGTITTMVKNAGGRGFYNQKKCINNHF